jgi:hypothetical protein
MTTDSNLHKITIPCIKSYEYRVYSIEDVEFAPNTSGIYCWFLRFNADTSLSKKYHDLYTDKEYWVTIEGNFKQKYEGPLNLSSINASLDNKALGDICENASVIFSPPLYLGIARNLRDRLCQHVKSLKDYKFKRAESIDIECDDLDTDKESDYFGQSFGSRFLNEYDESGKNYGHNDLFCRVIECRKMSKRQLQQAEYYLNRTFKPIYGRK